MPRLCDLEFFEHHRRENFSTAFLAFSLRRSDDFVGRVIKLIFRSCKAKLRIPSTVAVREIEPNYLIPSGESERKRPDLVLVGSADDDDFVIAVEVKRNADFHKDQLRSYLSWLHNDRLEKTKLLVTLTAKPCFDDLPHACLRWKQLADVLREMQMQVSSEFERSFWHEFAVHVETIMRTFDGFTLPSFDMLGMLREADGFLLALFEKLKDSPVSAWEWSRAAYWSEKLGARIGFYWCRDDFFTEPNPNCLCVEKNDTFTNIAPLSEVIENASAAVGDADRERYLLSLADRVRTICSAP